MLNEEPQYKNIYIPLSVDLQKVYNSPNSKYNILLAGDSFAFGVCVEKEDDESFLAKGVSNCHFRTLFASGFTLECRIRYSMG